MNIVARIGITAITICLGLMPAAAYSAPLAFTADGSNLVSLDIATGNTTIIGALGFTGDTEALAVDPTSGVLYLATDGNKLYTVDKDTGAGTEVGNLGVIYTNGGMAIDGSGNIFLVTDRGFFSVNKTTGAAVQIGSPNDETALNNTSYNNTAVTRGLSSGAFVGNTLYAGPDNDTEANLYTVDTTTGHATTIGSLGVDSTSQTGLTYDANTDTLYMLVETTKKIYSVDYATGQLTEISSFTGNFEGITLADPGDPMKAAVRPAIPTPTLSSLMLFLLVMAVAVVAFLTSSRPQKETIG